MKSLICSFLSRSINATTGIEFVSEYLESEYPYRRCCPSIIYADRYLFGIRSIPIFEIIPSTLFIDCSNTTPLPFVSILIIIEFGK